MDNVYPELLVPETQTQAKGSIRQGPYCIDTMGHLSDGTVGKKYKLIKFISKNNSFQLLYISQFVNIG